MSTARSTKKVTTATRKPAKAVNGLTKAEKKYAEELRASMEYVEEIPTVIPAGKILVHNHILSSDTIGCRGFRIWLSKPDRRYIKCDCGWAPHLGTHYGVRKIHDESVKEVESVKRQHLVLWWSVAEKFPNVPECTRARICEALAELNELTFHLLHPRFSHENYVLEAYADENDNDWGVDFRLLNHYAEQVDACYNEADDWFDEQLRADCEDCEDDDS